MQVNVNYSIVDNKVIINIKNQVCANADELLNSNLFKEILERYMKHLIEHESPLLKMFDKKPQDIKSTDSKTMQQTLVFLSKMSIDLVPKVVEDSDRFIKNPQQLASFVEGLYNFWRGYERFIVCDSSTDVIDQRPYRTFNSTIESLTQLIRKVYRDVQENITGKHPSIYRQVHAGAEIAAIALPKDLNFPDDVYDQLGDIPIIRQILLNPPLLLNPPMNKRTGKFQRIEQNPLDLLKINKDDWIGYPAKVGPQLIVVYFHKTFYELGFSLCNLFELADDEFLNRPVDAVYLYGVPGQELDDLAELPTVFYDDEKNKMLSAAVPGRPEFGYFGYLKKMMLTLHNVQMIKRGKMPYHGAMVKISLKGGKNKTVLIVGDTGTGKSEMLEALRTLGDQYIEEIIIIADDMGSLDYADNGDIIGYGTEIGAFVRLDDLQPGYALGQLDRAIIMSPNQVNSRIVLPVTTYETVIEGYKVDMVLYANNYEEIDEDHPIIDRIETADEAFKIFREGTAMSKGTTTSTGLVHSYFVNVFGAIQYKPEHDEIAHGYFEKFYEKGLFVGQMRTRLGIPGWEYNGPEAVANALLEMLMNS